MHDIVRVVALQYRMEDLLGKDESPDHPTGKFECADDGLLHLVGTSLGTFLRINPGDVSEEVSQAINFVYEVCQDLVLKEYQPSALIQNAA